MSEDQIKQMVVIIGNHIGGYNCGMLIANEIAYDLYNEGHRKQSVGKWEKRVFVIFDSEKVGYRCSECNTTWDTETPYCPNCGAKMKGEEDG